jgi:8-amino-7-oxononanoate synthase
VIDSSNVSELPIRKAAPLPELRAPFTHEAIARWLTARLAAELRLLPSEIDPRRPFAEYDLDSVEAVSLTGDLEEVLSRRLSPNLLWDFPTIEVLSAHLASAPIEAKSHKGPASPADGFEQHPSLLELDAQLAHVTSLKLFNPYFVAIEGVNGAQVTAEERKYINFSSYNYLGLSGHPDVSRAAIEAIEREGTSASASRLASGEKPLHQELEQEIADFLHVDDAIVYIGGHTTNVSTLACLVGPGDVIFHDAFAHDSILMGARLSEARQVPFPHNDWQALEELMSERRHQYGRALIVIEGVYSMDGDIPDVLRFVELKKRHHAWLMVDEAHSLGVLGRTGRGIGEHHRVPPNDIDVWMGTLSKSLASCGGYIAGKAALVKLLKYRSRGFVYSAAITPPNAAAALAALRKLRAEPERVAKLQGNIARFLGSARARGLDTGLSGGGAVVPIMVGDSALCLRLADALAQQGILVHPMVYPVVPQNTARLRFFITSEHTGEQIDRTVEAIAEGLPALKTTSDFTAP